MAPAYASELTVYPSVYPPANPKNDNGLAFDR